MTDSTPAKRLPPRLRLTGIVTLDPIGSGTLLAERAAEIGLPPEPHALLYVIDPNRQPATLIARDPYVVELIEALEDNGPDDLADVAPSLFLGVVMGWPRRWPDRPRIYRLASSNRPREEQA